MSFWTNSAVTTRSPAGRISKPFKTTDALPSGNEEDSAFLAKSEMTLPTVRFERAEISLAASRTSRSMSIVVLTDLVIPHLIQYAKNDAKTDFCLLGCQAAGFRAWVGHANDLGDRGERRIGTGNCPVFP